MTAMMTAILAALLASSCLQHEEEPPNGRSPNPLADFEFEPFPDVEIEPLSALPKTELAWLNFEDGTLYVQGGISLYGVADFALSLAGDEDIEEVRLFASGGNPEASLEFAQFIQQNALPVTIDVCLDACFSYLAAAASQVSLAPNALYGLSAEPLGVHAFSPSGQASFGLSLRVDGLYEPTVRLYDQAGVSMSIFEDTARNLELDEAEFSIFPTQSNFPTLYDYWVPSPSVLETYGISWSGEPISSTSEAERRFNYHVTRDHIRDDKTFIYR